ncbi:MAG: hypothetical protein ACFBSD_09210 [Paracoccaceae bacterium]
MKLSPDQIAAASAVLGAEPLPAEHPAILDLQQAFGDKTFYVDTNGLLVFEPTAPDMPDDTEARLMLVAAWTGEDKTKLGVVEPVDTGIAVELGAPTDSTTN